jgi:hypothetical protein
MLMQKRMIIVLASVFLLAGWVWIQPSKALAHSLIPQACTYGPTSNSGNVSTKVPGGQLTGNSVTTWSSDCFSWSVDANSNGPSGGSGIEAQAAGYDRCLATDPWNQRMYADHKATNTSTHTNAGRTYGPYFDCSQNSSHAYLVRHWHDWYSGSTDYETNGSISY